MKYVETNNIGIIALIKRNNEFEYNAIDSSYCVLKDYEKEINSNEFFKLIEDSKLVFEHIVEDFKQISETEGKEEIEKYLLLERPNLYIDFDSKYLVNYYPDRSFEEMVPSSWNSKNVKDFWEFQTLIPVDLQYWTQCQILLEYLTGFSTALEINEELKLIDRVLELNNLKTYDERWNYIENQFGGNIMTNKNFGWLSLQNYVPNLVINRESKKLYLAYLLDREFQPKYEVGIERIKKLLQSAKIKLK